jgi:hypothetical protein
MNGVVFHEIDQDLHIQKQTEIEVIDYSKLCNLTLNRQVITLLSSLGIEDIAFLLLQKEARLRSTMTLLKCREVISLLDKVRFYDLEQMSDAGSESLLLHSRSLTFFFLYLIFFRNRSPVRCVSRSAMPP